MKDIANFLFEAKMLKEIQRSGYHFLGAGKETVAEHSFMITFIAYVMAKMEPNADALKLITMCLIHDLPETRIGDLNYVQKKYVKVFEEKAIADTIRDLPFEQEITTLIDEFNKGETLEATLAKDADQISFILELKAIQDVGSNAPDKWIPVVMERLKTKTGKSLGKSILNTKWDEWWMKDML